VPLTLAPIKPNRILFAISLPLWQILAASQYFGSAF
jgi:hypothetical protein